MKTAPPFLSRDRYRISGIRLRVFADRDYNAAVNTHRVGMEQPFEPGEAIPLHHISVMQVLSTISRKPRTD